MMRSPAAAHAASGHATAAPWSRTIKPRRLRLRDYAVPGENSTVRSGAGELTHTCRTRGLSPGRSSRNLTTSRTTTNCSENGQDNRITSLGAGDEVDGRGGNDIITVRDLFYRIRGGAGEDEIHIHFAEDAGSWDSETVSAHIDGGDDVDTLGFSQGTWFGQRTAS
jgi:hypothetical protein